MTDYENCPSCNNVGWYAVHGHDGEPVQEQCEFCYTVENSIFNVIQGLEQQLATAKQEATAYRISLENLEASLPKVRADAFQAGAEWCETSISSWRIGQAADIYADKLEAGNE